jgi:hypothetical protein
MAVPRLGAWDAEEGWITSRAGTVRLLVIRLLPHPTPAEGRRTAMPLSISS